MAAVDSSGDGSGDGSGTGPVGGAVDSETVAVLLALAGVRTGDAVAQCGAGARVARGLLAMSGSAALASSRAAVAVAGGLDDVPVAVGMLAGGVRLVALAPDEGAARTAAREHGVAGLHLVALTDGVAWSGRLTGTSRVPH